MVAGPNGKKAMIGLRQYDEIVRHLTRSRQPDFQAIAGETGVDAEIIRKIYDGSISRPVVIETRRLRSPRRCRECGNACDEWPCVFCTMKRYGGHNDEGQTLRFK